MSQATVTSTSVGMPAATSVPDLTRYRGQAAVVRTGSAASVWAAFCRLDGVATEVHLLDVDATAPVPQGAAVLTDAGLGTVHAVVLPDAPAAPEAVMGAGRPTRYPADPVGASEPTRWVLYSSGTTGTPTPTRHTLASLARTVRRDVRAEPFTWGLLYEPTRMAGVQVVLHAMLGGAGLVDASGHEPLAQRVQALVDGGVDALSATPTLWRLLLQTPAAAALDLRQVTLGGETADQKLLDALSRAYPRARVTHVFASTETGAAFSVGDGRAGFPRGYLEQAPGGVRLQVRDGILHVHAPDVPSAPADGWVSTGDLVEVADDRLHFRGRVGGVVNVGGVKVWPEQVEQVLREHPAVADALVSSRSNPMSGSILTAAVTTSLSDVPADLARQLRQHCAARVPAAAVPAVVRVVDVLPVTANGKLARR
ncbi:AMP-binding enzyme [Aquipuribacter hungaricus]|uniref:Long-chain-fatty-acid--CoA ligase n=1 Tax=Aquipuribacter hungaricus TaxID=545624 RepID=A0ABV7WG85_9MICO